MSQATAIDAARIARDKLLASDLTPEQQQLVLDLENAMQDLNTAYWDRVCPDHIHLAIPITVEPIWGGA